LFRYFSSVWYVTPLLLLGQLELFFNDLTMKYTPEIGVGMSDWCISEWVLAWWRRLLAFMKATNLLHQALRTIVPPHRNGHRNGQQSGYILHLCFVCCRPGGRRGDTEQVVSRWWHLVAFMKALVMLHRAMPHVPLQRLHTTIKMACNGGAFIRCLWLFCLA